jgi:hypothetical protein
MSRKAIVAMKTNLSKQIEVSITRDGRPNVSLTKVLMYDRPTTTPQHLSLTAL